MAAPQRLAMPSRAWFVVAGAVLLLGLGAAAYPAREAATAVRTPVVLASGQQTKAALDRDGLMIFGSGFTFANCTAKDTAGGDIPLERVRHHEKITMKGRDWEGLLRSVRPVPPGSYLVTCAADQRGITFAVGARASGNYVTGMFFAAVACVVVSGTIAALMVLAAFIRRNRVSA